MRAAVLREPRELRVESLEAPVAGPGEVLLRVAIAGICGTDYRIWTGERGVRYPLIPGHEFIGDVVAVGPGVTRVAPGNRVAVEPNWGCGTCDLCREGSGNLCLARTAVGIDRDGGFAELVVLPERACWPAPVGLARELGADSTVVGAGEAVADAARRLAGRDGVDLVVETAGTAEAVELSVGQVGFVRPGGRVVLTGLPHDPARVEFFWVVRREIDIRGSMIYREEFGEAVALLAAGRIRVEALLTHRFPLEAIAAALAAHLDPASIKVAVFPEGSAG